MHGASVGPGSSLLAKLRRGRTFSPPVAPTHRILSCSEKPSLSSGLSNLGKLVWTEVHTPRIRAFYKANRLCIKSTLECGCTRSRSVARYLRNPTTLYYSDLRTRPASSASGADGYFFCKERRIVLASPILPASISDLARLSSLAGSDTLPPDFFPSSELW